MYLAFEKAVKAVESGRTSDALSLVPELKDLDSKDEYGQTLLTVAVMHKNAQLVKTLLEMGANPNIKDMDDMLPLNYAILNKNKDVLNTLLVSENINLDLSAKSGMSPLMYAIAKGRFEEVELLVAAGAKTSLIEKYSGMTCVHAVAGSKKHGVKILEILSKAKDFNVDFKTRRLKTPLLAAAYLGNSQVCNFLLDLGADICAVDDTKRTVLHYAAISKDSETLKLLLERNNGKIDVYANDADGFSPVFVALAQGDTKMMEVFFTIGKANENAPKMWHLLRDAVFNGKTDIVKVMLDNGFDLSGKEQRTNFTMLHYAMMSEKEGIIDLLLDAGADMYSKDINGMTPLDISIRNGYKVFVDVWERRHDSEPIAIGRWKKETKDIIVFSGRKISSGASVKEIFNFESKTRKIVEYSPEHKIIELPERELSKISPRKVLTARKQLKSLS